MLNFNPGASQPAENYPMVALIKIACSIRPWLHKRYPLFLPKDYQKQ